MIGVCSDGWLLCSYWGKMVDSDNFLEISFSFYNTDFLSLCVTGNIYKS